MSESRTLDQFPAGSLVRIDSLCECPKARSRLCALGLTPGTVVRIEANGAGPRRIMVRDADLVIGQGLCGKVTGTLVTDQNAVPTTSCACASL